MDGVLFHGVYSLFSSACCNGPSSMLIDVLWFCSSLSKAFHSGVSRTRCHNILQYWVLTIIIVATKFSSSAATLWHLLKQYTCLVLFIGPSPRKRGLVHTVSTCVTLVIFNVMFVITNPQETLYIMCISRQWVPGFSWGELVKVTWY